MRCISPLLIRTSGRRDFVPCGKCNFCLQVKRADWTFRLLQEQKQCLNSSFLTLTYDDERVTAPVTQLVKRDVQLFQKRLRKENSKSCEWPLRYYTVGEYGTKTERPHYHSIMFNLSPDVCSRLGDIWSLGNVHVGDVQMASIHYVTKYVINRSGDYQGREPPFSFMSKRPGIGSEYLKTHTQWHRADSRNYTQVNGTLSRLPRYYKDKMFNSYERARMAAESISIADEGYDKTINKLSKFHDDPYYYHDERTAYAHNSVKTKVNSLNKF